MMRLCPIRYGVKYVAPSDPCADEIISLLHLDSTSGANNVIDEYSLMTAYDGNSDAGLIQLSGSKFGGGCATASGVRAIGHADTLTYVFTSLIDFTQEAWFKSTAASGSILSFTRLAAPSYVLHRLSGGGGFWTLTQTSSGGLVTTVGTEPYVANTWQHIAIVRDGLNVRVYIDGVKSIDVPTTDYYATASDSKHRFNVDRSSHGGSTYTGLTDEYRLTLCARYTDDFTPETGAWPNP